MLQVTFDGTFLKITKNGKKLFEITEKTDFDEIVSLLYNLTVEFSDSLQKYYLILFHHFNLLYSHYCKKWKCDRHLAFSDHRTVPEIEMAYLQTLTSPRGAVPPRCCKQNNQLIPTRVRNVFIFFHGLCIVLH